MGAHPSQGAVTRGRADAPMTWGEESPGRSEDFAPEALTPAEYADAERSGLLGLAQGVPEVAPLEEGAGLVEVEASSGGSAWRRRLAPSHRQAVRNFFQASPGTQNPDEDGSH